MPNKQSLKPFTACYKGYRGDHTLDFSVKVPAPNEDAAWEQAESNLTKESLIALAEVWPVSRPSVINLKNFAFVTLEAVFGEAES